MGFFDCETASPGEAISSLRMTTRRITKSKKMAGSILNRPFLQNPFYGTRVSAITFTLALFGSLTLFTVNVLLMAKEYPYKYTGTANSVPLYSST
jgi:hypothetical protein